MKYIVEKDKKKRYSVLKLEKKRNTLKAIKQNEFLSLAIRGTAASKLHNMGGERTRLKNHCVVSYRSRGVLSQFKLSRMVFKNLASFGFIPGVKKSSW